MLEEKIDSIEPKGFLEKHYNFIKACFIDPNMSGPKAPISETKTNIVRGLTTLVGAIGGAYVEYLVNGINEPLHWYSLGLGATLIQAPFAIYEKKKFGITSMQTIVYGSLGFTCTVFNLNSK